MCPFHKERWIDVKENWLHNRETKWRDWAYQISKSSLLIWKDDPDFGFSVMNECIQSSTYAKTSVNLCKVMVNEMAQIFSDDIFKCICFKWNVDILITISLQFACKGPFHIIGLGTGLASNRQQAITWNLLSTKLSPEPLMSCLSNVRIGTHYKEILLKIQIFHWRKCIWKCL